MGGFDVPDRPAGRARWQGREWGKRVEASVVVSLLYGEDRDGCTRIGVAITTNDSNNNGQHQALGEGERIILACMKV